MAFVGPVHHGTWQLATPTLPHDTAPMPLSLRGDSLSVNCAREQLVPTEGYGVFCGSRVCAFAQERHCLCHHRPHVEAGLHGLGIDLMHRRFRLPPARSARRSTSIALESGAPSQAGETPAEGHAKTGPG
jgi:hypothetical protein